MPFARALGGAERLLRSLALRGRDAGLDLHVAFLEPGPLEAELRAAGVRTSVTELGRFRDLRAGARAARRLRAVVRAERPELLLAWLPRAHPYLVAASAGGGARRAWWQHHTGEGEERLIRAVTALPAEAIVCTSEAVARRQAAFRPRRPLVVCHPGVEVAAPGERPALDLPAGALVVGIPGRLVPWKGQDRLLEALALLRRRGHHVAGLVVGGNAYDLAPGYEERLHARAAELGLPCAFTGHVDDALPYIAAMDVLVNASEEEPFGMTLPEAMALGVPVLAVGRGGPAEIVEPGVSGLLVADGRPETLAAGLEQLLGDRALRERLAAGGRAAYAARFTAEAFAERAAETVSRLARGVYASGRA